MKQLEIHIMGQSYVLGCPDGGEARLLAAVERVDSATSAMREAGRVRSRERIAVLTALNLAFELSDQQAAAPVRSARFDELLMRLDNALNRDDPLL